MYLLCSSCPRRSGAPFSLPPPFMLPLGFTLPPPFTLPPFLLGVFPLPFPPRRFWLRFGSWNACAAA
ncbi:unnamed protein product, partial [Amoebophrya sp. A120]|eukprot:GSA120T00001612001.1